MSKPRGFCLEDIYSRQSLRRFEASKYISEGDDRYVRATLADNPFYKKIHLEFGDEGIREFIRTIQLKQIESIDQKQIIWLYSLQRKLDKKTSSRTKGELSLLDNPEQNQILTAKKSKGLALVFTKLAYNLLKQRHEARQLKKKVNIFSKLPYFTQISNLHLKAFCQLLEQQKYQKNNFVYHQNDLAKKLYIVKEGIFVMNRYNDDRKKYKSVLQLDNSNIFGEQCLQFSVHSKAQSRYICEVSCKSNQGILFIVDRELFARFPLNKDLSLATNIYQMYVQRRKIAEGKQFQEYIEDDTIKQGDKVKKYYQRLYRLRRRNPTRFIQQDSDKFTNIQFFRKQQFANMKLKLKYQSILDKVKTMNSVTLQKIQINTKNQPKSFTKGVIDSQKKFILKSLQRRHQQKSEIDHSQMVMNALKIHAEQDYPKHKSEYLRVKHPRVDLYNSQATTEQVLKRNSMTGRLSPIIKIKSESNVYNFIKNDERSYSKT